MNQDKNCFQKLLDIQHDDMITDFISSSEYFTKYFIMDSVYKNRILKTGMPRNEFLIRNKNNGNFINLKRKNIEGLEKAIFLSFMHLHGVMMVAYMSFLTLIK
ncbi:hypothetical protein [Citrobacter koseri]|uniref:hypothetical protein n=1 Tax=Citrobacter koseri TaxID=545 RepID=UPI001FCBC25B|nr:hypothetical protein [Citrobacter koseri]